MQTKIFLQNVWIIWTRAYFETTPSHMRFLISYSVWKVANIIGTIRYISFSKADCHATIKWFISSKFREKQPEMAFYIANKTAILYFLSKCVLQNMVSNRIQHPTTPSQPHTVCIYCTLTQGRGGGRVEPQRRLEGQQFTKLGRKYQHDWMYLQSINSDKHLPQSPFTGQFF